MLTRQSKDDQSIRRKLPEAPTSAPKEKNPAAVALGLLGASKGGKARARNLSSERRSEIARMAATERWSREKD
jgi:hypothetical protein